MNPLLGIKNHSARWFEARLKVALRNELSRTVSWSQTEGWILQRILSNRGSPKTGTVSFADSERTRIGKVKLGN